MSRYDKLKKLISDVDELITMEVTADDPKFKAWKFNVTKLIKEEFGEDSLEMSEFEDISFTLSSYILGTPRSTFVGICKEGLEMAKEILKVFAEDYTNEQVDLSKKTTEKKKIDYNRVFIVHGHDDALKERVARIIEKQEINAIILSEQINKGKTIIEKFEEYSDVPCAICLFTKDDIVVDDNGTVKLLRARQNVVFETGYFMGKIGRDRVIILSDSDIDMPTDLSGVLYTSNVGWETKILRELKDIGYNIDMNR